VIYGSTTKVGPNRCKSINTLSADDDDIGFAVFCSGYAVATNSTQAQHHLAALGRASWKTSRCRQQTGAAVEIEPILIAQEQSNLRMSRPD
jgi:hypothetical protein